MAIGFLCRFVVVLLLLGTSFSARSDEETRERFYGNLVNSTASGNGEGSIAKMFDRVLEKEFSENDQPEGSDGGASFNSSVADQQADIETVAKVTHEKGKRNDTQEKKYLELLSNFVENYPMISCPMWVP